MHACRDFVCIGKGRRSVGIPNFISSLPVELVEGSPLGIAQQMAARRFSCIPAACNLLVQVRFPRDVTLLCLALLHAVRIVYILRLFSGAIDFELRCRGQPLFKCRCTRSMQNMRECGQAASTCHAILEMIFQSKGEGNLLP